MKQATKWAIRKAAAKHLETLAAHQELPKVEAAELREEIYRMKLLLLGNKRSFGVRLTEK